MSYSVFVGLLSIVIRVIKIPSVSNYVETIFLKISFLDISPIACMLLWWYLYREVEEEWGSGGGNEGLKSATVYARGI